MRNRLANEVVCFLVSKDGKRMGYKKCVMGNLSTVWVIRLF
jgi:hypothetical protein